MANTNEIISYFKGRILVSCKGTEIMVLATKELGLVVLLQIIVGINEPDK
jgi:hypothetical protein